VKAAAASITAGMEAVRKSAVFILGQSILERTAPALHFLALV
jgi:hypothetical protein